MKIFVVFWSGEEDYVICGIFSTQEKAENFIEKYKQGPKSIWHRKQYLQIEEFEVDDESYLSHI